MKFPPDLAKRALQALLDAGVVTDRDALNDAYYQLTGTPDPRSKWCI